MARVTLPQSLTALTGGQQTVELVAADYRGLLRALEARFPGCREPLEALAVAIDGTIYQTPFLESLDPDSDVHFLPRIEGG
ncbi:MAG: MoaD/ThiS family protein [Pseudomonadota bacterium]